MLELDSLTRKFGGLAAVQNVSVVFERGKINAIIGPNGAGKTTLFNCFSRLYTPSAGDILFEGQSILTRPPHSGSSWTAARGSKAASAHGLEPCPPTRSPRPARPGDRPPLAQPRARPIKIFCTSDVPS